LKLLSSLRVRLLLLVALAIIPALVLILYAASDARRLAERAVREDTSRLARLVAARQADLFRDVHNVLIALSRLGEVRTRNGPACSALFADLHKRFPSYTNLAAATPAGDIFCTGRPLPAPVNVADRAYFRQAVASRDFAASGFLISRLTGKPLMTLAYPSLGETHEVRAVVIIGLDLGQLNRVIEELQMPSGAAVVVVDERGMVLARMPDPDTWVGKSVSEAPIVKETLARRAEGTVEAEGVDSVRRLYSFAPLPLPASGGTVYVAVGIPLERAFADSHRVLRRSLAALAVAAGFAFAATWIVGGAFIVRPATMLVAMAKRVAAGDLTARAALRHRRGELGELAQAFDGMVETLQARDAETRRAEAALSALTRNLEAEVEDRTATLVRERAHLEAVLAGIGEGVCVTDAEGRVEVWNRAAEGIADVPASAMLGRRYPGALRSAYGERVVTDFSETVIKRALDAGEPVSTREPHFFRADGTQVPITATAAPVRDAAGAIVGCVNVFRDITLEKEVDRMKSEFVSTVSHELRTPLTSIRAYAETLRGMVGDDATVQEFLGVIEEESVRLTRLINDLLNLSRIESGRIRFKQDQVALPPLVTRAIQTAQPKAAAGDVHIETHVPADLPPFRGDDDAIQQVLTNLVDNAVKYNRPGGRVAVRAAVNGGVAVEIRDTGIGMPEGAVRRLGERFFRVDSSDTRRVGGTGLGMTLVKEILAAHGTQLEIESVEGVGSSFRFVLPLAGGGA
jgi:PAS domain S-box-containing protein